MLKHGVLVALLCTSVGQILSMESSEQPNVGCLNFLVDWRSDESGFGSRFLIQSSSAQGLEYFCPQKDFLGKDITQVIPLNKEDSSKVAEAFLKSGVENKKVLVKYMLIQKQYEAKITPLFKGQDTSFFVKVKEVTE